MPILPPPKNAANPFTTGKNPVVSPLAPPSKPVVSPFTATTSTTAPTSAPASTTQAKTSASMKVPNSNNPSTGNASTGLSESQVKSKLNSFNSTKTNQNTQSQNSAMNNSLNTTNTSGNQQNYTTDPAKNLQGLYSATAPIDLTQFQPDITAISTLNNKVAETESAKRAKALQLEGQAINAPTTGDFYQNNLGYANRLAEGQLANLGTQQNAANQTLQTKLALAQAQRTGGIEQANVPFKFNTITTPSSQVLNTATGQTVGNSLGNSVVKGANVQSLQDLTSNYNQMQANLGNIDSLQQGLASFLGTSDLNPSSIPQVNQTISTILKAGAGDPKYQQLQNYVNDIASKYSIYFGNGGAPTNQVRDVANSLINGNASPQAITEVLAGLSSQARQAMQGTYNQIKTLQNNPSGVAAPSAASTSAPSGSNSSSQSSDPLGLFTI